MRSNGNSSFKNGESFGLLVPKLGLGTPSAKLCFAPPTLVWETTRETEFRHNGSQTEFGNQDNNVIVRPMAMRAVVYRPNHLKGSWRPCSLVDRRGPRFPDEYLEILAVEVQSIDLFSQFERMRAEDIGGLFDRYTPETGDVVFLGEGDDMVAYVAAPFGWELVKFGAEWKSPTEANGDRDRP
jgi:hypothetical protein